RRHDQFEVIALHALDQVIQRMAEAQPELDFLGDAPQLALGGLLRLLRGVGERLEQAEAAAHRAGDQRERLGQLVVEVAVAPPSRASRLRSASSSVRVASAVSSAALITNSMVVFIGVPPLGWLAVCLACVLYSAYQSPTSFILTPAVPNPKMCDGSVILRCSKCSMKRGRSPVGTIRPTTRSSRIPCCWNTNSSDSVIVSPSSPLTSHTRAIRREPSRKRSSCTSSCTAEATCSRIARTGNSIPAISTN